MSHLPCATSTGGARFHTTPTGIRIGCCAQRQPAPAMDDDALRLQRALIGQRSPTTRVLRNLFQALTKGVTR